MDIKIDLHISGTISIPDPVVEVPPVVVDPVPEPIPEPIPPKPTIPPLEPTTPPNFYQYARSVDTRTVYVSSSYGLDTNDGLSSDKPKKTISAGVSQLRTGYPDWLLLKRGDVFTTGLGDWRKSGRSATEPMVVWSYGTGTDRPILKTGVTNAITTQSSSGVPIHSMSFVGLHFYAHTRDPNGTEFTGTSGGGGIHWLHGAKNVVFDDLKIESYTTGIAIQDYFLDGVSDVSIVNCVIIDSYCDKNNSQGHSSGLYVSSVKGLLVENCVIDHNGWNEIVAGGYATIFNHNVYVQTSCDRVVMRNNIISRASSHGIHFRPGGLCENNLFFRNPINVQMGYTETADWPDGVTGTIIDNVIQEANDIAPTPTGPMPRGWGIYLEAINIKDVTIQENVVAHLATTSGNKSAITKHANAKYLGNVVWDYPVTDVEDGVEFISTGPFYASERKVADYAGASSVDTFYQKVRAQSRDTFDLNYSASAVNNWFRQGFAAV